MMLNDEDVNNLALMDLTMPLGAVNGEQQDDRVLPMQDYHMDCCWTWTKM